MQNDTMTPGQLRLAKANWKRLIKADTRHAERMRSRGWTVIPPQEPGSREKE